MEVKRATAENGIVYRIYKESCKICDMYTIEYKKDYGDCTGWHRVAGSKIYRNLEIAEEVFKVLINQPKQNES